MKYNVLKISALLFLLTLLALGFYFNFQLANKEVRLVFFNKDPEDGALFRQLVYVSGAVENPGVYEFSNDMRVLEAIELAGGLKLDADQEFINKNLNFASKLKDEQQIFIPFYSSQMLQSNSTGGNKLININTASLDDLDSLPGVGPSTAEKIIQARPFSSKEDLLNISGFGDAKFEEISKLIEI